jgi:DNA-binding MarR family transcriptional regulator
MDIFPPEGMTDQCMVVKTRRAARAVTRRYNALLRPLGIQSTQASLLYAIWRGGFGSVSELADRLGVERSALTRNLQLLRAEGLVEPDQEGRGRAQRFSLTDKGQEVLKAGVPLWIKAQKDLRAELGEKTWADAQAALARVGETA